MGQPPNQVDDQAAAVVLREPLFEPRRCLRDDDDVGIANGIFERRSHQARDGAYQHPNNHAADDCDE